ncbi:MAG: hypothetical protein GXP31_13970 [Kiritimatiellaeota bacterium]|nr:hypothetical protein [Kiritimatiellota bacterium]
MNLLKAKSQFYYSLSTLVDAGVITVRALRQNYPQPFRRIAREMADRVEHGEGDLGRLMEEWPRVFSPMETHLVAVGQQTGRLDTVYTALAEWFDLLARLRSEVISRLMYPAFMYCAASVLIPFIQVFLDMTSPGGALLQAVAALGLPVGVYLVLTSGRRLRGPGRGSGVLDLFILQIPVLGNTSRKLNYARFFRAYALALNAGVHVPAAIRLAADTCTNGVLASRFRKMADTVETEGCPFVEAFRLHSGSLGHDDLVTTILETGEEAGNVVETAQRMARIYWEEAEQSMQRAAVIVPLLVYFALILYMASMILKLWGVLMGATSGLLD